MESKQSFLRSLGTHVRKIREKKGKSQSELAAAIGKEQQSIQRLEAGNINPSIYYLCEIAEGLGVSLNALLNFKE